MDVRRAVAAFPALVGLALGWTLTGCEDWPRYLHEAEEEAGITQHLVIFEDESLGDDEIQDLGDLDPGTEIAFHGFIHTCGKDDHAPWPEWPLHDLDSDGDGIPDQQTTYNSGWYTGDVDWVGFGVNADTVLSGSLEWTNRPSETDLEASDEATDLDFVVFVQTGAGLELVNESGVSTSYPETLAATSGFPHAASTVPQVRGGTRTLDRLRSGTQCHPSGRTGSTCASMGSHP